MDHLSMRACSRVTVRLRARENFMRELTRPIEHSGLLITTLDIGFHRSVGDLTTCWYLAAFQSRTAQFRLPPLTSALLLLLEYLLDAIPC